MVPNENTLYYDVIMGAWQTFCCKKVKEMPQSFS